MCRGKDERDGEEDLEILASNSISQKLLLLLSVKINSSVDRRKLNYYSNAYTDINCVVNNKIFI